MKRVLISCIMILLLCSFAQATVVNTCTISDSTVWTSAGNPYQVRGLVTVSTGWLTITGGVQVYFDSTVNTSGIIVNDGGHLLVNGTSGDSVLFSGSETYDKGYFWIEGWAKFNYAKFVRLGGCNTDSYGGAIHFKYSNTGSEVSNCYFYKNKCQQAGGAITLKADSGCSDDFTHCYANIQNSYFRQNRSGDVLSGGAIILEEGAVANISYCTFDSNYAPAGGGAIEIQSAVSGSIHHCVFFGNHVSSSSAEGAAIANNYGCTSAFPIYKNLFYNNHSTNGTWGTVSLAGSGEMSFWGNTITSNDAESTGGVYIGNSVDNQDLIFKNNIIWGNSPSSNQVTLNRDNYITYCDIEGGYTGTGNIDINPAFSNPSAKDFTLSWSSPCKNAGDPSSTYTDPDLTVADMGAYYRHLTRGSGDVDDDCDIDAADLSYFYSYLHGQVTIQDKWKLDCNGNCTVNYLDYLYLNAYLQGTPIPPKKNDDCPPNDTTWTKQDACSWEE